VNSYAPENFKEEPRVKKNVKLSGTMTQMEKVSVALIDLANCKCIRKTCNWLNISTLNIPFVFVANIVKPQIVNVGALVESMRPRKSLVFVPTATIERKGWRATRSSHDSGVWSRQSAAARQ
jgi:hypothetical protein